MIFALQTTLLSSEDELEGCGKLKTYGTVLLINTSCSACEPYESYEYEYDYTMNHEYELDQFHELAFCAMTMNIKSYEFPWLWI